MIDPRRSARWRVGFVTTGIVSLAAAAAVGWAAATPIGTTAASAPSGAGSGTQTAQLAAAQANLQQVRADLARILSSEDDLPRAATLPALQLPSVQVPAAAGAGTTVQVAPPVAHTTTGASGVVVP